MDTAKTAYQADVQGTTYRSAAGALRAYYQRNGVQDIYRGFVARTTRVCGAFFVVSSMREYAIQRKTEGGDRPLLSLL